MAEIQQPENSEHTSGHTIDRRTFIAGSVALAGSTLINKDGLATEKEVPLADIHVHSDCSHSANSIQARAQEFDIPAFKGKTVEEVSRIIYPPEGSDWNTWYKHLQQVRLAYVSPKAIGALIEDVIRDAAKNNVNFLELRVSLISTVDAMLKNQGITSQNNPQYWEAAKKVFDQILEALERTKKTTGIKTDLVMSVSCQKKYEVYVDELMRLCKDHKKHIVGIDLTNELDNPASHYRKQVEGIRGDIQGLTIHCMETQGPERGWDALTLNPDRIGHGIRAIEDPKLVEELISRGIPLEMCVRSNLVTGVVGNIADHPMPRLHKAGVKLTIGSDGCNDGSTLLDNYEMIQKAFGFTAQDMAGFRKNSFEALFRKK
ncbi:hypothetical protein M0P48_03295 [Candidatus Gracilibacteria bacterium]|nr:hypothetical protein [Candidatus Gracilibacteria bacterium]